MVPRIKVSGHCPAKTAVGNSANASVSFSSTTWFSPATFTDANVNCPHEQTYFLSNALCEPS